MICQSLNMFIIAFEDFVFLTFGSSQRHSFPADCFVCYVWASFFSFASFFVTFFITLLFEIMYCSNSGFCYLPITGLSLWSASLLSFLFLRLLWTNSVDFALSKQVVVDVLALAIFYSVFITSNRLPPVSILRRLRLSTIGHVVLKSLEPIRLLPFGEWSFVFLSGIYAGSVGL